MSATSDDGASQASVPCPAPPPAVPNTDPHYRQMVAVEHQLIQSTRLKKGGMGVYAEDMHTFTPGASENRGETSSAPCTFAGGSSAPLPVVSQAELRRKEEAETKKKLKSGNWHEIEDAIKARSLIPTRDGGGGGGGQGLGGGGMLGGVGGGQRRRRRLE